MPEMIKWGNTEYEVVEAPTRHICINALENKPEIKARWNTKESVPPKSCTQDVIHLVPYKNCTIDCSFCSLPRYRGFGLLNHKYHASVVFTDYSKYIDEEIAKTNFMHTVDFGADADVFMRLNDKYHETEKTMAVLNKWGIPFSVSTKGKFTDWSIDELAKNKYSWAQMSIITNKESDRKKLIPGEEAATVADMESNIDRLKARGIKVTARVQPYIPYFSTPLEELIPYLADLGFDGIVFGMMRAPMSAGKSLLEKYGKIAGVDYSQFYTEKWPAYWQLDDKLTKEIVGKARKLCDVEGLKFGLCDMYCRDKNGNGYSIQDEFGNACACECVNAYGFTRKPNEKVFHKVDKCIGNCLKCTEVNTPCGNPQFASSVKYTMKDYQKLLK